MKILNNDTKPTILKGSVTRFDGIFYESNSPGPLIDRLKWFCRKIRFRGDIREITDSALTITPYVFRLRGIEFLKLKIRLYRRKRIFQQKHFSLLIRGPGGIDL